MTDDQFHLIDRLDGTEYHWDTGLNCYLRKVDTWWAISDLDDVAETQLVSVACLSADVLQALRSRAQRTYLQEAIAAAQDTRNSALRSSG